MKYRFTGPALARAAAGAFCALAIFAAGPHWLGPREPRSRTPSDMAGQSVNGRLVYRGARLGDAIDDLNAFSGMHLVAMPELRGRRFSGTLPGPPDTRFAAQELARQAGLRLVRAGPHWALVDSDARAANGR